MYRAGDHYVICDRCGFKFLRSQTKKTWDNLIVCSADWEPRHPLETPARIHEHNNVRDARPEGTDRFLTDNEITPESL